MSKIIVLPPHFVRVADVFNNLNKSNTLMTLQQV